MLKKKNGLSVEERAGTSSYKESQSSPVLEKDEEGYWKSFLYLYLYNRLHCFFLLLRLPIFACIAQPNANNSLFMCRIL